MLQDQLYEVPRPDLWTKYSGNIAYRMRVVWYALFLITEYPVISSEISLLTREIGEYVTPSEVGKRMKILCENGYFTRESRCGTLRNYKYTPTTTFTTLQKEYLEAVA